VQPEQQPDRGGLTGAVRAKVAIDLALPDVQVERVERQRLAIALGQLLGLDRAQNSTTIVAVIAIEICWLRFVCPIPPLTQPAGIRVAPRSVQCFSARAGKRSQPNGPVARPEGEGRRGERA